MRKRGYLPARVHVAVPRGHVDRPRGGVDVALTCATYLYLLIYFNKVYSSPAYRERDY